MTEIKGPISLFKKLKLKFAMAAEEVGQNTGFDKVWSQLPHFSLYQLGITAAAGYTGSLHSHIYIYWIYNTVDPQYLGIFGFSGYIGYNIVISRFCRWFCRPVSSFRPV